MKTTAAIHRRWPALLLAALLAAGCSGGGPAATPAARPSAAAPAAAAPRASIVINFRALIGPLRTKAGTLPEGIDHAICTLSNGAGLLAAPLTARIALAGVAGDETTTASAVFSDLPPGDGYTLQVSLYDAQGLVVDRGRSLGVSLAGGANSVSVLLVLTSGTAPTITFFSGFLNNTSASTVVVAGDTLHLLSGVNDANGVVSKVELWLDGTAANHFTDGTLLHTWTAPDFADPFLWDTALLQVTGMHVQAGTPHTLSFNIHDNLSAPPDDLIHSSSFPITVEQPASVDVGIRLPGGQA